MEERITARVELETMPYAHGFYVDGGNYELCNATGYCVCLGDVNNPADWWDEFVSNDGELYYGR